MLSEIIADAEEHMKKTLVSLGETFSTVRTGRANAKILDHVTVDYYGVPTPINQLAGIKTPEAHLLVIEPWDKGSLGGIEHAIVAANLGVNPNNDGTCIRLPFPQLTEERRKELAKQCKTYAEEARIAIRNIRRDANTHIGKAIKEEALPEDQQHIAEDKVQKLTDKYIAEIDAAYKKKEEELMEI